MIFPPLVGPLVRGAMRLRDAIRNFHVRAQMAAQMRRERTALRALDARELRDVGITAEQARIESARDDWDIPDHRLPYDARQRQPESPLLMIRLGS